jgi:hypothetical protein
MSNDTTAVQANNATHNAAYQPAIKSSFRSTDKLSFVSTFYSTNSSAFYRTVKHSDSSAIFQTFRYSNVAAVLRSIFSAIYKAFRPTYWQSNLFSNLEHQDSVFISSRNNFN